MTNKIWYIIKIVMALSVLVLPVSVQAKDELLNVSYDATRGFYEQYNVLFQKHWKEITGEDINLYQSHGGSGKQARSVIDGLKADVVTLALSPDIDAIVKKAGLIPSDWASQLPLNSVPYTSTIVFMVRKGNPKQIHNWSDLVKQGVAVVTPHPKTSGGARWNYLAAYGYALEQYQGDKDKAKTFMKALFKNVPILESGARSASTTFAKRNIGDVLLAWENEAYVLKERFPEEQFEIVYPSVTIKTEPPVAVVQKVAERQGTVKQAKAYLEYLYSVPAQRLLARFYFRPTDSTVLVESQNTLPPVRLITIHELGGWKQAQKNHFDDGGLFDEIILP